MGYQALLFCPDEKTARTVTQVLSELEFSVEPCAEPFAAVKRLMGAHFDAVVVDCDNEQNAALIFKSARNSGSNQAALAVAVVEGQAGVAKAFRIGANLVLTKPINVEQAKGTLRVARGLLRKGDPAKAAAPTVSAPAPPAPKIAAPAAAAPPKPVTRPAAPATTTIAPPPPVVSAPAKPAQAAYAAVASSAPAAHDESPLEINLDADESSASNLTPAAAAFKNRQAQSAAMPMSALAAQNDIQAAAPVSSFGSGAASAPAPARSIPAHSTPAHSAPAPEIHDAPAPHAPSEQTQAHREPESSHESAVATSFTFGGANAEATSSSGGSKKVFLAVAAVAIVAAALYFGWTQFHDKFSAPAATPAQTAPQAAPAVSAPAKAASTSPSAPSQNLNSSATPASAQMQLDPVPSASDDTAEDTSNSTGSVASEPASKTAAKNARSSGTASSTGKAAAKGPIVVKSESAAPVHAKQPVTEAAAPSMIGIAPAGSGGTLSNLIPNQGNAPKPILQTVNLSQGVSQGLLVKKIQPVYPPAALRMHVEGPVTLSATISKTGSISAVKVVNGEPMLAKAAADAVKQWKYKPYYLNGEPVEINTQITVNFKLPN